MRRSTPQLNDDEPGLHEDYKKWLEWLAPYDPAPSATITTRRGRTTATPTAKEVLVKRLPLIPLALLLVSPCPVSAQTSRAAAARAALLETDTGWAAAAGTGDVERIVSYWTDDAVIYSPREAPVSGKTAIRQYVTESLKIPGFAIRWKPGAAVVSTSGELGYTTGTNSFTFPDAQGRLTTTNGRYVTVWRKEPGGRWRCVVDFWNEAPSPPEAAAQK